MTKHTVAMLVVQLENMATTIERLEGRIITLESKELQAPVAQPSNNLPADFSSRSAASQAAITASVQRRAALRAKRVY